MRITVYKRDKYSYIAFKDNCPFEWATGYSKQNAVDELIEKYSELKKVERFIYIKPNKIY